MKKVLITGFTAPQVGSARTNGINHVPGALANAARRGGFDVDHRVVALGESLHRYDAVIVCVMSLLSLTTSYALGALWALAKRRDAVIVVDDWQTATIVAQFQTAAERPDYYLTSPQVLSAAKRPGVELLRRRTPERAAIFAELTRLSRRWEPHPVAAPVFPWGNVHKLNLPTRRPLAFDPSSGAATYTIVPRSNRERERCWVLASLFDHAKWLETQELIWPIEVYGQKRHGHARLTEAQVVQRYAEVWGVLAHTYDHALSGWWRPRFLHAAQAGAILYGDRAELELIAPDAYTFPRAIEEASLSKLRELADHQARRVTARLWPRWRLDGFVRRLLEGAL